MNPRNILRRRHSRFHLIPFRTTEGHILFLGLVLALLYCIFLAATYFVSQEVFQLYIGMTATNILFGRAAGMSFGYALDYGHLLVLPANFLIEAVLVLLVYPLFVFSWRHLLVFRSLDNFMQRIEKVASTNEDKIRRYGIPSLFVFVFFPFWMTGPVVGAVIGFFLDIKPWINVSVVLSATGIACIAWALLLKQLHEHVADFNPFAPFMLLAVIILIAVGGYLLETRRKSAAGKNRPGAN